MSLPRNSHHEEFGVYLGEYISYIFKFIIKLKIIKKKKPWLVNQLNFLLIQKDIQTSILLLMLLFSQISCVYNTGTSVIARILTAVFPFFPIQLFVKTPVRLCVSLEVQLLLKMVISHQIATLAEELLIFPFVCFESPYSCHT